VGRLIHFVVVFRLEEEMADLPAGHGHQPAQERRRDGVGEHQRVGGNEAEGADEVKGLVDSAVMVIAMIVPPLDSQSFEKVIHRFSPFSVTFFRHEM
jgi:hypothetical protein